MIIQDLQPFSIVQDRGFLQLLEGLEPSYQLPSRNTFANSLLEQRYNKGVVILQLILKQSEWVTITTDKWTSSANESYTSVTAHFITKNWELKSCLLDCFNTTESHTAQNIANEIKTICNKWNIAEKVHCVVTDNAANVVAAVKLTNWVHLPCFAHTLNLIVQQGIQIINDIRVKVKTIVEFFHRSTQANTKLLTAQTRINPDISVPLKLKNDVPTRWNSTYYMFQRIILLEEPLTVAVGLLRNPLPLLSEEEWIVLKEICQILQPFEQMTSEMSAEKSVTVSKIVVVVNGLYSVLKRFEKELTTDTAKLLITDIISSISRRFANFETNSVLAKATFLDPRFKRKGFSSEDAYNRIRNKLQDDAVALINKQDGERSTDERQDETPTPTTSTCQSPAYLVWQEFDIAMASIQRVQSPLATAISEIRMFVEEPNITRTEDPLLWWKNREILYPTLANLAKKQLCIVATSVPSERVFSKAGQIITDRRNRLSAKHLQKIIFLNYNQHLFK